MAEEYSFIPKYYRIEIDPSGLGGSDPDDGFIDNTRAEDYDPQTSTLALSEAKERANTRYFELIRQLSTTISPVVDTPRNINKPGADGDNPPTAFDFTVVYDRPEYLATDDEENPGTTLTGEDALKRFIARALTTTRYDVKEIFDPESVQTVGSTTVPVNPKQILELTTGAIAADISTAEANITVSEITNT